MQGLLHTLKVEGGDVGVRDDERRASLYPGSDLAARAVQKAASDVDAIGCFGRDDRDLDHGAHLAVESQRSR
jgi:hypothetical protein